MAEHSYILTLYCRDQVGIVAAVSGFMAERGGWIAESSHHGDPASGLFFMRMRILAESLPDGPERLRDEFARLAARFGMTWEIHDSARPQRVLILASREDHCLADLLYRWRGGEYPAEIVEVVSNHELVRPLTEWHGVRFRGITIAPDKRGYAEQLEALFGELRPDLIVLARYMQIIPENLCEKYFGRIINIHHGFLPSFKGARPYHQAYERGVKLIGATCHYITAELDAGPIIEQDVIRVSHAATVEELVRLGRDVEKAVLARGVRWHLERRVLLDGQRTVVFQ